MNFTAWSHDSEWYGFRISKKERDTYFPHELETVILELPYENKDGLIQIQVNVSNSFWNKCPELRSSRIRNWFNENGYPPPATTVPPRFTAEFINKNTLRFAKN